MLKLAIFVSLILMISGEEQQKPTTPLDANVLKAKVRNEFEPIYSVYTAKFNEIPLSTANEFYQSCLFNLTSSWDKTKYKVLDLFNPLPCGNCKEAARKIERDINYNNDAFREEYTVERIRIRLREGFRDGYERLLLPAHSYMEEFKPYDEQLANVEKCWDEHKDLLFKVFNNTYHDASNFVDETIKKFIPSFAEIGKTFDEGLAAALTEAARCSSFNKGFGYCEFLYFDEYYPSFVTSFQKTKRRSYDVIEEVLTKVETTVLHYCTEARKDYVTITTKLDACLGTK